MARGVEQRKAPRSKVNVPAQVRGGKGFFTHARCMTLSPHGVEMLVDWPMELGASYRMTIEITSQLSLSDVRGTCVRCLKVGAHYRSAVSFVNLDGPTFQAVALLCGSKALAG